MWQRFSNWLERISTGRVVLIALGIFVLFTALVLPRQASAAERAAAGAGTPDMSFSYSTRDLYRMAEAYGEEGRAAYVRARFTFDLIWPLVYTFFLATSISWLLRGTPAGSLLRRANLVPALGAAFDYLENFSTSLVMMRYPQPTALMDQLAPAFTLIKWVLVYASFLLLVVGIAAALARRFRGKARGY
jgi:hypothetical protein